MKKRAWFVIILLWLIFLLGHNINSSYFFCKYTNYCNDLITSQDFAYETIESWNLIYKTWTKIFESVGFDLENPNQRKIFENNMKTGMDCEYKWPFAPWGDYPGCFNISWYIHVYTVPNLWIEIIANANIWTLMEEWISDGLFLPSIKSPFELKNNTIYNSEFYIEYHDLTKNLSISSTIEKAPNSITFNWKTYSKDSGDISENSIIYRLWNEDYMILHYMFQEDKNYYYTIWSSGMWCAPWPCGLEKHDIKYFMK